MAQCNGHTWPPATPQNVCAIYISFLSFADWLNHRSILFCVYALHVVQVMAKRTRGDNDDNDASKKSKSKAGKNLARIVLRLAHQTISVTCFAALQASRQYEIIRGPPGRFTQTKQVSMTDMWQMKQERVALHWLQLLLFCIILAM